MKICPKCDTQISKDYRFCPWCGKEQESSAAWAETAPEEKKEPRFTPAQLEILRSLLEKLYPAKNFRFSEEKILWGAYEFIWGALDGSGMDSTEITITPIHLARFDLQDLHPGFCPDGMGCAALFKYLADNAQDGQVWSVSRPRFGRRNKNDIYEHVHKSDSLAVRNPMGIGVDLLVTYENYDDMD